ncbi:MAG TPA: hypothetical protein PLA71_00630 [Saccharofermentans sp.]|nr:hypothetical protein [Saccharofermentans sp.]
MSLLAEWYSKFQNNSGSDDGKFTIAFRPKCVFKLSFEDNSRPNFLSSTEYNIDDLSYLFVSCNLPNIQINPEGQPNVSNFAGNFIGPGSNPIAADKQTFSVVFLDTEYPVIENFFVPWMMENVEARSERRSRYPLVRSTIELYYFWNESTAGKLASEDDISLIYKIYGAYPTFVDTPDSDYAATTPKTRSVGFEFNKILPITNFKNKSSLGIWDLISEILGVPKPT